jgi:hypothetical protein
MLLLTARGTPILRASARGRAADADALPPTPVVLDHDQTGDSAPLHLAGHEGILLEPLGGRVAETEEGAA